MSEQVLPSKIREDDVRLRELQRMIGNGTVLSAPILAIILVGWSFSVVTNAIVGNALGILPAAIGVMATQTIIVGVFMRTEKYDQILARALVLLYVAYYAFIVLAVNPDYNLLFIALLGFPPFTVLIMGSREGTFWSVMTTLLIGGGALIQGINTNFESIALSHIVFVLLQTTLSIVFVYVVDIVARRYALQMLSEERSSRESEARYGVLLNSITDGLIATDRQGVIQFANKAAQELTGLSLDQLHGKIAASTVLIDRKSTRLNSSH